MSGLLRFILYYTDETNNSFGTEKTDDADATSAN